MQKIKIKNVTVAFITVAGVSVIDNAAFNAMSISDKTKTLGKLNPPFLYVENFGQLCDLNRIKKKMLLGEDVTLELQFNGLDVPTDLAFVRQRYMDTIAPVLATLAGMRPVYPFDNIPNDRSKITVDETFARRGSHKVKITMLLKIWKKMAPKWAKHWDDKNVNANGKRRRFSSVEYDYESGDAIGDSSNSSRHINYYANRVEIGCQTIHRYELEQFALTMGWDFPATV